MISVTSVYEVSKNNCLQKDVIDERKMLNGDTNVKPEFVSVKVVAEKKREEKLGVTLSWKSISASSRMSVFDRIRLKCSNNEAKDKTILEEARGIVKPGQMLGLLGASGSGKTTLLNVLNFRSSSNLKIQGNVMINGNVADYKMMSMVSSYIQQQDLFFGTLTVKEHLEFHAMLRMDRNISVKRKRQRVVEVLKEFNLDVCKNVKIGIPGRIKGISGGQKRRLSFASEILTDPPLLFCDEPTSGLDSYMAKSIVKCLQKMAQNGKTIICTIHQPSSEIFEHFDQICLLSEGRLAYFGDRQYALTYFSNSLSYTCPKFTNPADFYIDVLGIDVNDEYASRVAVKGYCEVFSKSEENKKLIEMINHEPKVRFRVPTDYSCYKATRTRETMLLFKRNCLNYFRNHRVVLSDFFMTMLTAALGGFIFFQLLITTDDVCTFDQTSARNASLSLFYAVAVMTIVSVLGATMTFPLEIPIFSREHQNCVYRIYTYYLSKVLFETPIYIFLPTIFSAINYFMVQYGCETSNFGYFLFGVILISNCSYSLGHVIGSVSSSVSMAISLVAPLIAIQMLFSGFYLNEVSNTPEIFVMIKYISIFNYGYDYLMVNQFNNDKPLICEYTNASEALCKATGRDVLTDAKITPKDMSSAIAMLIVLTVTWRLLALTILFFKTSNKTSHYRISTITENGDEEKEQIVSIENTSF